MATVIGTKLSGRYRIEDEIGSGGMSTVYRAFDETLEREVAVKIMHSDISSDAAALERFRREARTVAQLSHPHVVMVIDAGEDHGHPYIVFEHVGGETLKERIRREGPLPIAEAVAYAIEIGRALQVAHERGLVHRDVKPQNVLIDEEGRAKVTDFGIALGLEAEGLTAAGRMVGTTDYVSPEQAMGHEVNGQSDVYSLGIVLYEMITGEVPFKGESGVSVAMKHVREGLPDLQRRRPGVSAALAAVVERATAKELRNRYASMADLVADLEETLTYETARAGEATGEATAVLSQLPGGSATRKPVLRRLAPVLLYLAIAAAVAVAAVILIDNAGKNSGSSQAESGLTRIPLSESAVHDYDPPPGGGSENPGQLGLAVDGDKSTAWETENYDTPDLGNIKKGVGLYLDAGRPVVARALKISTPKSGWTYQLYVANSVPTNLSGWTLVGGGKMDSTRKTVSLDTARQASRYYLLWITRLTSSPTGRWNAAISDLQLLG
jgi:eukaryotic-like serine/threonine-protein kinase